MAIDWGKVASAARYQDYLKNKQRQQSNNTSTVNNAPTLSNQGGGVPTSPSNLPWVKMGQKPSATIPTAERIGGNLANFRVQPQAPSQPSMPGIGIQGRNPFDVMRDNTERVENQTLEGVKSGATLPRYQNDLALLEPLGKGFFDDENIENLKSLANKYGVSMGAEGNYYDTTADIQDVIERRIASATQAQRYAQQEEQSKYWASYFQNPDFAARSGVENSETAYTSTADSYDYINDLIADKPNLWVNNSAAAASAGFARLSNKNLDFLKEDERALYNYLYNTQGEKKAGEFLDFIKETLNYRYGQEIAGNMRDSVLEQIGYGAYAGLDRFGGGIKQLFSEEALPTSPAQFAGAQIREDLGETGPKIFGSSLGQLGYDAFTTVGNMAPSILVSAISGGLGAPSLLAQGLGAASMGASISGNAYNQALDEGKTQEQARTYAALVGASEAGLQFLLGGIGKLGGITDDILLAKVQGIDNALKRIAATAAIKIGSEVLEENLQNYIEPALRTLIFEEDYKAPTFEDIAYTTLLTMITTGVLESGNIAAAGRKQDIGVGGNATGPQAAQEGANPLGNDSTLAPVQSDTAQNNAPLTLDEIFPDVKGAFTKIEEQQKTASGAGAAKADSREVVIKLQESIPTLQQQEIVSALAGTEFGRGVKKLSEQVNDFFNSIGNTVFRKGFGNVVLNKSGIKSDMAHGIGRAKAITFAAVPDVIQNGVQIDYQENWKGRGYDTYVFAAPVEIDGNRTYVAAVVKGGDSNKFYLHEVVDANGNVIYQNNENSVLNQNENAPSVFIKTGDNQQSGVPGNAGASSIDNIPQSPANYNPLVMQNNSRLDFNPLVKQNNMPQATAEMTRPIGSDKQSGPHIDDRSYNDVSSRKVNAFQFDNPELHPYFAEAAQAMKQQLSTTIKGERGATNVFSSTETSDTGGYNFWGVSRSTSDEIGRLLDNTNLTYAQISKALDDLIADHGQENYAAAKKVELVLDDMLTNGYEVEGIPYPPNAEYVQRKEAIRDGTTEYRMSEDEWNALMASENALPPGTGAASAGFAGDYDALQALSTQFMRPGETPYEGRHVEVPARDLDGRSISKTAQTVMEAQATPDTAVPTIEQAIVDGDFSYDGITNAETLDKAVSRIQERGFALALSDWKQAVKGRASADNTVMGWALYNTAVNSQDINTAMDILTSMASYQRENAQALQAQRILKKMSPEWQLYNAQRSVANMQEELTAKYGEKAPDLSIDEELIAAFLDADTQEARDAALYDIYKDIGRQLPATFADKWNAWRYMSMLTNARTHIRNIAGNAGFAPVRGMKNTVATGIEAIIDAFSKDGIDRTKAILNYASEADRALFDSAWGDYASVQEQVLSSGKFDGGVNTNAAIQDGRQIFGKPLSDSKSIINLLANGVEGVRKGNSFLLDAEDSWFSKPAYARALAGWLKANNTTLETADSAQLDSARAYAIREAQRATYRDLNAFSELVTSIGFKNADTTAKKITNAAIEGILPFKKTPANILVRGVEYSPIGLIKGLTYDLAQVHKGNMSAAQAIDNISAGLTGTGLMALGGLLASMGFITGGGSDDDKQDKKDDLTGHQSYALEIGGKSITLDWLAPEAIPFFMGVELWGNLQDGDMSFWDVLSSLGTAAEPMLEMSMLQSLNDLFDAGKYSEGNKLLQVMMTAATSYFTQGIPTLSGQLARTIDGTRRSSYIDPNSEVPSEVDYFIQSLIGKVPGAASAKEPYIDAWGRQETEENPLTRFFNNFLNPAYTSDINETDVDAELQRLYDVGQANVFPTKDSKSFKLPDGTEVKMTGAEYTEYSTVKGQTAYSMISDFMKGEAYSSFSDSEKAKVIADIYSYATAKAKQAVSDYEPDGWIAKVNEAEKHGITANDWFSAKHQHDAIADGSGSETQKTARFAQWLEKQGYSEKQQEVLRDQLGYWMNIKAEAERYDGLTMAGLKSSDALAITEKIAGLAAPEGHTNVQKWQQYEAIVGMNGLGEDDIVAAMALYESAGEGDKSKVQTAANYGVDMQDYADFFKLISGYKEYADKSTVSKNELTALLNSTSYSTGTKAVLWAMNTTAKSGNPYGRIYNGTLDWVYGGG